MGAEPSVTATTAPCPPPLQTATPAPHLHQATSDALAMGPLCTVGLVSWATAAANLPAAVARPPQSTTGRAMPLYECALAQSCSGAAYRRRLAPTLVESTAPRHPLPALYKGRREEKKLILGSRCEVSDSGK
jgi:hypothetical protein